MENKYMQDLLPIDYLARQRNRKTIAAWVARWQRMSALNLQYYLSVQTTAKAKGAGDG